MKDYFFLILPVVSVLISLIISGLFFHLYKKNKKEKIENEIYYFKEIDKQSEQNNKQSDQIEQLIDEINELTDDVDTLTGERDSWELLAEENSAWGEKTFEDKVDSLNKKSQQKNLNTISDQKIKISQLGDQLDKKIKSNSDVFKALLPNISFLKESEKIIDNMENLKLLRVLGSISHSQGKKIEGSKKVEAMGKKNRWWECKFSAGNRSGRKGRIYYMTKNNQDFHVMVSYKENQISDYKYLSKY